MKEEISNQRSRGFRARIGNKEKGKIVESSSNQTANAISASLPAPEAASGSDQATSDQIGASDVTAGANLPSSGQGAYTGATSGEVIGSKTGKKYYFPWCGTVKRIKPENQVVFASIDLAKAAGYTPGGNCKGLQ